MASQQEFADWRRHPVTQEVVRKLTERKEALIEQMLNLQCNTLDEFGLYHLVYRNKLEGLGEFLDLDYLQEVLANDEPAN